MALSTQPYKGARDFYPDEKRIQKYMFGVMRDTVEKFGYEEYDAPILEPLDLYAAKTGDEIVNEQTYTFEDRGGRKVAIRPEMTPTVSRMVAGKRQELAYPVRWYSIPNLWRYERPQRGRLREHWQLNVDIFGVENIHAEHEIIQVADSIMQAYGAKRHMYTIKLNSRQLMDALMKEYLGLNGDKAHALAKLIDRKHKMEETAFNIHAAAIVSKDTLPKLQQLMQVDGLGDLPEEFQKHPSVDELKTLTKMVHINGIDNVEFDITLMRGFDYYTDIVFEVFDNHPDNNRSMFGGGRYDGLVSLFGVEPAPTVGFGMGDVTLQNFLETHKLLPKMPEQIDLYVALVGDVYDEIQTELAKLRSQNLKVFVDLSGRKLQAQLKAASKRGVRNVMLVGEEELKAKKFVLHNMDSGKEQSLTLEKVITTLK